MTDAEYSYATVPIPKNLEESRKSFTELNRILMQIQEDMSKMRGLDGRTPEFAHDVSMGDNKLTGLAPGSDPSEGVRRDQVALVATTFTHSRLTQVDEDGNLASIEDLQDYILSGDGQLDILSKNGKIRLYIRPFSSISPSGSAALATMERRIADIETSLKHPPAWRAALASYLEDLIAEVGEAGELNEINGDGTTGRVLRKIKLEILDGTDVATIKCEMTSEWNGDSDGPTDNISKGATVGNYSLSVGGDDLTIETGAITGNMVAILSAKIYYNASGIGVLVQYEGAGSALTFRDMTAGTSLDLTTLVNTGGIFLHVLYLTNE